MKANAVVQQVTFCDPRMFHDFPSDLGVFKARSDAKLVRAPSDTDMEKRSSPRERLRVQNSRIRHEPEDCDRFCLHTASRSQQYSPF